MSRMVHNDGRKRRFARQQPANDMVDFIGNAMRNLDPYVEFNSARELHRALELNLLSELLVRQQRE